jgi:hypothetical protein
VEVEVEGKHDAPPLPFIFTAFVDINVIWGNKFIGKSLVLTVVRGED